MGVYPVKGADQCRGYNLLFQITTSITYPYHSGLGIPLSEKNTMLKRKPALPILFYGIFTQRATSGIHQCFYLLGFDRNVSHQVLWPTPCDQDVVFQANTYLLFGYV